MRRNFVHNSAAAASIGAAAPKMSPSVPATSPKKTPSAAPLPVTAADTFALPVEAAEPKEPLAVEGKAFDAAVKRGGGHFATIKPSANTYMPVYYSHGKSYAGKVHHVKGKGRKKHVGSETPSDSASSSESSSSSSSSDTES